ncbi:hypothetical protein AVW11_03970 [Streptomyces amritsarensis]|uniref:Virion structural protein n=1 Tax=Streptomyces amritsarensis TaxID=681158 RepID=A0ABX3GBS9_9ACTN|nr:hypothetical protein [Streptomyces amritsarensis]OLZ72558.1 hypothetical protein AVW11_03970 [Streptomyces amritsarensis]
MADLVLNIALGRLAHYASLPAANDALIAVPLETSGLVADSTMRDYDTLAALLAGASNEQASMGRKTLASVTVTVDDADERVEIDAADIVWTAAAGNPVSAIVVCYDPDTTGGTDADLVPLGKFDFVVTPDGSDITATITDLFRVSSGA